MTPDTPAAFFEDAQLAIRPADDAALGPVFEHQLRLDGPLTATALQAAEQLAQSPRPHCPKVHRVNAEHRKVLTEPMTGTSLSAYLEAHGPPSLPQAAEWVSGLCEAFGALIDAGIPVRLAARAVFIVDGAHPTVRVLGFHPLDELGVPSPPEQLAQMGELAHLILTGRPAPEIPRQEAFGELPPELAELIRAALEGQAPESLQALAAQLQTIASRPPSEPTLDAAAPDFGAQLVPAIPKRPSGWWVLAALGVAAAAVIAWAAWPVRS